MLKEELSEETSVEQRIVNASLRCIDTSQRSGVEALFSCFGCFAEDEVVPAAALELLAPIICERGSVKAVANPHIKSRKWMAALLRASLLSGSAAKGVQVHDLVRDVMIARADSGTGGMVGLQVHFSLWASCLSGSSSVPNVTFFAHAARGVAALSRGVPQLRRASQDLYRQEYQAPRRTGAISICSPIVECVLLL